MNAGTLAKINTLDELNDYLRTLIPEGDWIVFEREYLVTWTLDNQNRLMKGTLVRSSESYNRFRQTLNLSTKPHYLSETCFENKEYLNTPIPQQLYDLWNKHYGNMLNRVFGNIHEFNGDKHWEVIQRPTEKDKRTWVRYGIKLVAIYNSTGL